MNATLDMRTGASSVWTDLLISAPTPLETGQAPGSGTFACIQCDARLVLEAIDQLPGCPDCGGTIFKRCSLFEAAPEALPDGTVEFSAPIAPHEPAEHERPAWLADARAALPGPGRYLAYEDAGEIRAVALEKGWTRLGRSAIADIQLDDPSVSRRHALVVWEAGRPLRVLDDRSLNGIFINGELSDWGPLSDGDELAVGSFRLIVMVSGTD